MARALRWLLRIGGGLLLIVLLWILFMMFQPSPEETRQAEQPLSAPAAAQSIDSAEALPGLIAGFPIPALAVSWQTPDLQLTWGVSEDVPFEGGVARRLTLNYRLPGGQELQALSLYPARALSLVRRENYRVAPALSHWLAGVEGVAMTNGSLCRLHIQTAEGVYALLWPAGLDVSALLPAFQLFSPAD